MNEESKLAVGNGGGSMEKENEDCPICYDIMYEADEEQNGGEYSSKAFAGQSYRHKQRVIVQDCGHAFCRECLTCHCQHSVSVKKIPIPCPAIASHDCENVLNEALVKDLLRHDNCQSTRLLSETGKRYGSMSNDNSKNESGTEFDSNSQSSPISVASFPSSTDYWSRFQRFQKMLQDPSLVTCSRCHDLFSPDDNLSGRIKEQLSCPSCGHQFCRIHGDAHQGQTCEEYSSTKEARQLRKSEKAIRKFTKPCSHCEAPIEKESGCDHIVCSSCQEDMCFRCGTHVHLSGDMIRSCERCQQHFVDHRHIWKYRFTLLLSLPVYIPVCIIHIVVVGILAIATCGCCCCLGCGSQVNGMQAKGGSNSSRSGSTTDTSDSDDSRQFRPLIGARVVLGIVFLPVVDLLRQCGLQCCCELDLLLPLAHNSTMDDDDDGDVESDIENDGDIDKAV